MELKNNICLDFYYFSYQCPLNDNMLQLLDKYKDKIDIHTYDISNDYFLAEKLNIFFPTLVVINNEKRYYSPINDYFLELVSQGKFPNESPYLPELSDISIRKIIQPLTLNNINISCNCCGNKTSENCMKKENFLLSAKQEIFGFIHIDEKENLIGGAEYLPTEMIPYHIPHGKEIAFITCVYMSDSEYDYKSEPLKELEIYLKNKYTKLIAISDETGVFPNGDLKFFIRNGYQDEGIIFTDPNYCKLHLMSKFL